jgi:hypothetical protein
MGILRVDRWTNSCTENLRAAGAFAKPKNQLRRHRRAIGWRTGVRARNDNRKSELRNCGRFGEAAWRFPWGRE